MENRLKLTQFSGRCRESTCDFPLPGVFCLVLLYTAVTRAKSRLVILGQENTIAEMIANDRKTVRYTNLREMLLDEVEE